MSDCTGCIKWQVRHQISHIQELERELDNLKGREQTYFSDIVGKVELQKEAKHEVQPEKQT